MFVSEVKGPDNLTPERGRENLSFSINFLHVQTVSKIKTDIYIHWILFICVRIKNIKNY